MKKLLFFLSFATILACSSSDDDSGNSPSTSDLHPPVWIQGTWGWKNGETVISKEFKFTNSNIYRLMPGSDRELITRIQGVKIKIEEEITDNKYYITCTYEGSSDKFTYFFDKVSSTKIDLQNTTSPSINPPYDKLD